MNNRFFFICAFCIASAFSIFAQELPKNVVPVAKSKVIEELTNKKKENPRISARKLADFGNALLARDGYEFTFSSEQDSVLINNVDVDGDGFEIYKLIQFDGKTRLFGTREHGSHPCGTWTGLTVVQLNATEMTVLASGKSYRVKMPKELVFDDIELVEKNLKNTIRRWLTPLDATPEAISKDGKIIYVPSEIDELFLGIADDGRLNFISAADTSIIKKNTELKDYPKDPKNDYLGYKKFSDGEQSFFVKFSYPCT